MPDLDYYTVLNLSRSATENDIKKAYHKMALRWHPDKNQERKEEAEKKFKEISEAYQVLSDKEKRAVYDKYGKTGLTGVNASADRNAEQRAKRERSQSVPRSRPQTDFYGPSFVFTFRSPDEVFSEFFGGRDPFEDIFPKFGLFGEVFSQGSRVNDKRSVGHHGGRSTQQAPARHQSNSHQPRRRQPWDSELIADFNDDFFKLSSFPDSWNAPFPASLNPSSGKNVRSSTTSTKTKNGKKIVTKRTRTVENGVETIIVEENGIVKSRDVRYSAQEL